MAAGCVGDRRFSRIALASMVLLFWAGPTLAQAVDTTLWVANGAVLSAVRDGNTIYLGGLFTRVGPATGGGVPIDATSGAPVGGFPKVTGIVYAVAGDGSGGWYIGGDFAAVGGIPRQNLAHILSDQSISPWNPNANSQVYALAVSGTRVYAGGIFTNIGGQPRNYIAALDATTGLATAWNPNSNGTILALAMSGASVLASGGFSNIGGQARNNVAALDAASGLATAWDPNANGVVYALAVSGTRVYAGGFFSSIGGQPRNSIAALDKTGGLATAWDPNANSGVYALAVNGSSVYAGGSFTGIGGQVRNRIAALDTTSGLATAWNPNASSTVWALAASGASVYAGGQFSSIGGQTRNFVATLDAGTGFATAWNPDPNSTVRALAANGTTVFVGGGLTSIGGQARSYLAALDATSGIATAWNPNANSVVYALAVSGTNVYAGGAFTSIGGQARNNIAALDTASGLATAWDPNASASVYVLAVGGTSVYAGGNFGTIGGQARSYIAALDAGSGLASAWNPNANGVVRALALSGTNVYAGGSFTSVGGQARNNIAALDVTSGLATAWNPNANGSVFALAPRGTSIYAGGDFSGIGGQTRNHIAALDSSSGLATAWNPNPNSTGVWALAVSGTSVYAGGEFTIIGGQSRSNIAVLDAGSGLAVAWNANTSNTVWAFAVSGARVYAGGYFHSAGVRPQSYVAAIAAAPALSAVQPASGGNAGSVTLAISGSGLPSGATITLTRSGYPDLQGTGVSTAADGASLGAVFDLTDAATGLWNVVVTTPDAQTASLPNGFTIETAQAPQLRLDLVGRDSIRSNYPTAFDLVINNLGNVDAVAVPLWITGIPLDATVGLSFPLSYPHRDGGEPDWSLDSLSFTGAGGRYLVLVIPRIPPGTVSRRINLTVPPSVASFRLGAAVAPPWENDPTFRGCLTGAGVISNGVCMGARLASIDDSLAAAVGVQAMSGIGVWSKIGWQCEGATDLASAQNKAHLVLDYLKQPIEQGSAATGCGDALLARWQDALTVLTVGSVDPNDKLGARRRLSIGQNLPYTVLFENLSSATLPARHVRVVDNLDLNRLDPNSIQLGMITIGDVVVVPPDPRATTFSPPDVPLRQGMSVRVLVTVQRELGLMTWDFKSIDPATGRDPSDEFAGFLPRNQLPPEGQGSVQFTVMPLGSLADGSSIQNTAAIIFDGQTNNTPPWASTVDKTAPTSRMLLASRTVDSTHFTVRWEALGSPPDLKDFTIYVSENGAPFHPWLENTVATAAQYSVGNAYRYAFYSIARDTCGNVEAAPSTGQDTMYVLATPSAGRAWGLVLEGAHPNPTPGAMRVWFTLASREGATLELIDIAGRRVLRREIGAMGPGRHSMTLGTATALRAGLYFLRLEQGGEVRRARVAVIR